MDRVPSDAGAKRQNAWRAWRVAADRPGPDEPAALFGLHTGADLFEVSSGYENHEHELLRRAWPGATGGGASHEDDGTDAHYASDPLLRLRAGGR